MVIELIIDVKTLDGVHKVRIVRTVKKKQQEKHHQFLKEFA